MRLKYLDHRDQDIPRRILAAAEVVFADKGIEKATLKEITERAEVNVAAVSYYFGSKSVLALAVFDELSTRLNEQRILDLKGCISSAKEKGKTPDLDSIIEVFIRPYVDMGKSGRLFARLVMQHRLAPTALTKEIATRHFDPMAKSFIAAISEACPHLDPGQAVWRYMFMIGAVVYVVADAGLTDRASRISGGKVDVKSPELLHGAMVDFLVGGLAARSAEKSKADVPSKKRSTRP